MNRLLRVPTPVNVVLVLCLDIALSYIAFLTATYFTMPGAEIYLWDDNGILRITAVIAIIILAMHFQDLYSNMVLRSTLALLVSLLSAVGVAFLASAALTYLNSTLRLPLRIIVPGGALFVLMVALGRRMYIRYLTGVVKQLLLFVGRNALTRDLEEEISTHPDRGFGIMGYLADEPEEGVKGKWLGRYDEVEKVARSHHPDRIVIGLQDRRNRLPLDQLLKLRFGGFIIEEAAALYESVSGRVPITAIRPSTLIFSGELGPGRRAVFLHNTVNFVVAAAIAAVCLPLMALIAAAVKLTSRGPVLYRQKRIGLHGEPFWVMKFRTMVETAVPDGVAGQASVTPLGELLRKSRLNELPQIFNVLRGEMSFVGPRPERPEYVAVFLEKIPFYEQRHCVRPGITGWAQINYEHADTVEDTITKLEYDLYYIKYLSVRLDVFIILQTIKTVLLTRGAG